MLLYQHIETAHMAIGLNLIILTASIIAIIKATMYLRRIDKEHIKRYGHKL